MASFELLVTKIVMDPAFRKKFFPKGKNLASRKEALTSLGIKPTPEVMAALANVKYESIKSVVEALGDDEHELN